MIPFNKPYLTGKETDYIKEAVESGHLSGNGQFTKKCQHFLEKQYDFGKCLLTTSCSDALEMAAILSEVGEGDEVIVPSYTFVTTANAFVLRGATIVFADSLQDHPNVDPNHIEKLITPRTKAIVVVHYAGVACDMDRIMEIANKHELVVIEDAAQAITSSYKGRYLGSIGHMATFSFHETKNITSGEGGALVLNDQRFYDRAEIVWEKGTNRSAFFRGDINKYGWVDIGSSFLPSEVTAAFLFAQLENIDWIQSRRLEIWTRYREELDFLDESYLPVMPPFTEHNSHMFYLTCQNLEERDALIAHLRKNGSHPVFHYLSLHKSPFYEERYTGQPLVNSDRFEECLVRLPFFIELGTGQEKVIASVKSFFS